MHYSPYTGKVHKGKRYTDNGSMAAWYVLSCLGIYPVCPADNKWIKLPSMYKGKLCGTDIEEYKKKCFNK